MSLASFRTATVGLFFILFMHVGAAIRPAHAVGEFQANYDVQYAVSPAGKTIVTQRVYLINQLTNYYPQSYSLLIDIDKISNIIAYDDGGVITPDFTVQDSKTSIALHFNTKAVGLGKSLGFTLRYEHAGIASQNGSIWEIYIPGIVNDPDIGDYNVTLNVPPTFGQVSYVSPLPVSNRTWNKDQMIRGGITAAYGTSQNFQTQLSYTLTNPSLVKQKQQIALPPDTAFQKVILRSLSPIPESVTMDADGNWIATYEVLPAQTLSIHASLGISIFLSPRPEYQPPPVVAAKYLLPLPYWQSTDPKIVRLAQTHTTPRQIYDYVVATLDYDDSRVTEGTKRLGAIAVLENPSRALCMEFTDAFIAISRAAGIPARRAVGYAYTNNPKLRPISLVSDVLHAWPEYFDAKQNRWIPIDPTWGNTTGGIDYFSKLDYNHLTFALNGLDSEKPYPAGFYHAPDKEGKDVLVEFALSQATVLPAHIQTTLDFPLQVAAGTIANGAIVVTNTGGDTAVNVSVSATSDLGGVKLAQMIPYLLPYGRISIPITASFPHQLKNSTGTLRVIVDGTEQRKQFTVTPFLWLLLAIGVFGLGVAVAVWYIVRYMLWKRSHKH